MGHRFGLTMLSCLIYLAVMDAAFIKGKSKNVPRVGRSNEAEGPYDHSMGYVIKTAPSKNIPRMGRRNFDSENHFDIPKLYQMPMETSMMYDGSEDDDYHHGELEEYYQNQLEIMKR